MKFKDEMNQASTYNYRCKYSSGESLLVQVENYIHTSVYNLTTSGGLSIPDFFFPFFFLTILIIMKIETVYSDYYKSIETF